MDAMEINNATASVTITGENSPELQAMISKDQHKTIILGMGPSGDGGAFILKNGSRADGSANPSSGDGGRIQQQTTLRAVSDFGGAVTSGLAGADLLLATAPFILVLPAA